MAVARYHRYNWPAITDTIGPEWTDISNRAPSLDAVLSLGLFIRQIAPLDFGHDLQLKAQRVIPLRALAFFSFSFLHLVLS